MTPHRANRRQYSRADVDERVQLVIAEASRAQVMPLAGGSVPGRMTDVSEGGARVIVPTFLPRASQVDLELPGAADHDGRARARVVSVRMLDREPRYSLGLRFEQANEELPSRVTGSHEEPGP